MTPALTLIVHLDGGRERARGCLASLAALDPTPEFEAIVVDDASADLAPLLAGLEGDVRVIRNERRQGLATSAASAARLAQAETLVLLHTAPLLEPRALAPLLAALEDRGLAAAAATPRAATPGASDPALATRVPGAEAAAATPVPGAAAQPTTTPASGAALAPRDDTPTDTAATVPANASPHPVGTHALALRRADTDVFVAATSLAKATPSLAMAAICAELARRGRVETIAAAVAAPPSSRATSARVAPGGPAELTVVVPTLDAAGERVRACIAAIQATTEAPHQIVVVDNGAPPQGFTAPVNAGLRAVDTPYAAVMNDDVEPLPGWWAPLREALDHGATVTFPLTVEGGMREDFAAWCFALARPTVEEMAHAPGEFFDPSLRVWFQDTDLLARLRALGRPPLLVRESRIRHALSATVASEDPELRAWIERTIRADRTAFLRKHPHYDGAVPA